MNDLFRAPANRGNTELKKVMEKIGADVRLALDKYSVYDAKIKTMRGNKILVETKHRRFCYDDGMILERQKISDLRAVLRTLRNFNGIIYVNTFDDGTALMWEITDRLLGRTPFRKMECKKHTALDDGTKDKLVYLLQIKDATKIKYK